MKKSIYLFAFIILALAIFFSLDRIQLPYNLPPDNRLVEIPNDTEYAYLLNFEFDENNTISVEYPYTFSPDQSLFELTNDVTSQKNWPFVYKDYGNMGVLIEQIDDKQNGQDQKYWQYFIDGEQPQISVNKYYPKFGTTIDWKFIKSEF